MIGFEEGNGLGQHGLGKLPCLGLLPAARMGIQGIGKLAHPLVNIVIGDVLIRHVGGMVGKNRAAEHRQVCLLVQGAAGRTGIRQDGKAGNGGFHARVGSLQIHELLHGKFLAVGLPAHHAVGNFVGAAQVIQLHGEPELQHLHLFLPVHPHTDIDLRQGPVEDKVLLQSGLSVPVDSTDDFPHGTGFQAEHPLQGEGACLPVKLIHPVGPGIALVVYNHRDGCGCLEELGAVGLVFQGGNAAGGLVHGKAYKGIFQDKGGICLLLGIFQIFPDGQPVHPVAQGRQLRHKHHPASAVAGCLRLDQLVGNQVVFFIQQHRVGLGGDHLHLHRKLCFKGIGVKHHQGPHALFLGDVNAPGELL